jgi:tetratricopeptide (TPR) repeat protein
VKGAKVKEQVFEISAESLEEARALMKSQIPTGLHLLSEEIIADGNPKTIQATADTTKAAFAKARDQVPGNAEIQEEKELKSPIREVITLGAFDEQAAQSTAKTRARTQSAVLNDLRLVAAGRRGFLGIGKRPDQYEAEIVRQAVVEITYKIKAKISVTAVDEVEPLLSKDYYTREAALERVRHITDRASNPSLERAFQASEKLKEATKKQNLAHNDDLPMDLCREAIDLEPAFSAAYVYLSYLYRWYRKEQKLALEWAQKATKVDPENENAWNGLGLACVGLGDVVAATKAFLRVITLNPNVKNVEPYLRLIGVYERLKMWDKVGQASARIQSAGVGLDRPEADKWSRMVMQADLEKLREAMEITAP